MLRPRVDAAERDGSFPREEFRVLGRAGLLALPYPERFGGGGQPYQTYLQVVEELSRAWLAVGLGRERAHAHLLPAGDRGNRRSSSSAGCRRCSAGTARRLLPVGACQRLGCGGDADHGRG